jgi:hypothetical protein
MKKIFFYSLFFLSLFLSLPARAICPVCTIAIGAGVGLSRWLGVDDLISGAWIGALIVSMIFWTAVWLDKKNIRFKFQYPLLVIIFYAITVIPLYFTGIMGHPFNKFCGVDKLIFGIASGSIVFTLGVLLHNLLKKRNQDKPHFPFQKVVIPLILLIIISIVFYFICKTAVSF